MTTQLTKFQIGSKTFPMNGPVLGRKQTLALLIRPLLGAALVLPVFVVQAGVVFTNLYSFTGADDGAYPYAALVQGSDGDFYGTTQGGGTNGGAGTVFKINASGALTSLYSFTGGDDGAAPNGLVEGSDGNFYGTTEGGGMYGVFVRSQFYGYGTVFRISTNGALTSLYSFTGGDDGETPNGLVEGSDGNFYGTTYQGGANGEFEGSQFHGYGTVFQISANGTLTTLYEFGSVSDPNDGSPLDGANPLAGLVRGSDGNLYGTTGAGGTNQDGTAFKFSMTGALTSLHSFTDGNDGGGPNSLAPGSDGNFYGTTVDGGTHGDGAVFEISTNGALSGIYSFAGGTDGEEPVGGLSPGRNGNFYGTTPYEGANQAGTIFQVGTNGVLTTLYSFPYGVNGAGPFGLVLASDGGFYGTTEYEGQSGYGTIFRLTIVPDVPRLTIVASGTNVILTWPTSPTGFNLQSTTNLVASAMWASVFPAPIVVNAQNTVTNPITGTQQFYRLSQ